MTYPQHDFYKEYFRIFRDSFSENNLAKGDVDYYGITIRYVSTDGSYVSVGLKFKTRRKYCCVVDYCHHGFTCKDAWLDLRRRMVSKKLIVKAKIMVKFHVSVCPGSIIAGKASNRTSYMSNTYHEINYE